MEGAHFNGPFHLAMMVALSKRWKEEGQKLLASVSLLSGLVCTGFSVLIFLNADLLIDTLAPGYLVAADGILTREIAILQLKVMAPCALLAALIRVGFGSREQRIGVHKVKQAAHPGWHLYQCGPSATSGCFHQGWDYQLVAPNLKVLKFSI